MAEQSDVPVVLKGTVCQLSEKSCVVVLNEASSEERVATLVEGLHALLPDLTVTVVTSISQLTAVHAQ